MHEAAVLLWTLVAGASIGALFFGGLWWTIVGGLSSYTPALWFCGSLILRTGLAAVGFYVASHGDWRRLGACLSGFLIARSGLTWMTRPAPLNTA